MNQIELALDDSLPALDSYSIRVSNRARSVSLRVLPDIGLEVTVPRRFNHSRVPAIVHEHRSWIEKALLELSTREVPAASVWPPKEINLQATGQSIQVIFPESTVDGPRGDQLGHPDSDRYTARLTDEALFLSGPDRSKHPLASLIAKLLKARAKEVLVPKVAAYASVHNIAYKKVAIRGQKTLWGSCSSSGTLSLNFKLLFLEPSLVDYVILHELAHVRYMNHSKRFWSYLETLQPGARVLDKQLNPAVKLVPDWLETRSRR